MIVIADTTPLNYLVLIGEIELLPALHDGVVIPDPREREAITLARQFHADLLVVGDQAGRREARW